MPEMNKKWELSLSQIWLPKNINMNFLKVYIMNKIKLFLIFISIFSEPKCVNLVMPQRPRDPGNPDSSEDPEQS